MALRRTNPLIPLAVALAVGGGIFVAIDGARDDGSARTAAVTSTTATSTTTVAPSTTPTTEPAPAVPLAVIAAPPYPENPPGSYHITYDVVENDLARVEDVTVVRPFESLVVSTRDGTIVSGTATSRTQLWTYLTDRSGWLPIQPELHRAAFDQRPLAAMATMVAMGRAQGAGTGAYLGRPCRIFVTGQPLSNPGAVAPTADESTEVCIDEAGLVLHERWQLGGSPVTERTATAVDVGVDVDPAIFSPAPVITDAPEFSALLSSIAVAADDETIARLQTDITPPAGYDLAGTVLRSGSKDVGDSATEIVRFYTDGTDLIELAEITVPGGAQLDGRGAVRVDIDGPETWFSPDFRSSAIRTRLSDTTFVELRGADPSQLASILPTLTHR